MTHAHERNRKRLRFGLGALLLAVVVVAILLVAVFPKIITGDFAQVKAIDVTTSERGFVQYHISIRQSADTVISISRPGSLQTSSLAEDRSHFRLPTWPYEHTLVVDLIGETEPGSLTLDPKRLIRPGDEFVLDSRHTETGENADTILKLRSK